MPRYTLEGLDCPSCAARLETALRETAGLEDVAIDYAAKAIELQENLLPRAREVVARLEPGVRLVEAATPLNPVSGGALATFLDMQRGALLRVLGATALLLLGVALEPWLHETSFARAEYLFYLPAYLLVGHSVLRNALRRVRRGDLSGESVLMAVATLGAIAIHQLPEAVTVMLFYTVGEMLQDFAAERARRSVAALLNLRPEQARVRRGAHTATVRPEEVAVGETILVQPGERIPLDGRVVEGECLVDTAALTGESLPRFAAAGAEVMAGMVCTNGIIAVEVTRPFAASALTRILRLVEEAAGRKSRTEQAITRFARYYTPAVVAGAAAVALLPPLLVPGAALADWFYRALILLVVSCPCALMVSVPLGYFGGIGAASRHGILVKGANFLDALADLDTVAFDKTGTLTRGAFRVSSVTPRHGFTAEQVLEAAARVEAVSPHPIAASVVAAHGRPVDPRDLADYEEIGGFGVKGTSGGRRILVGHDRLLHREGVPHEDAACATRGTVLHVAVDGVYAGLIAIADELKPEASEALAALRRLGVRGLALFSGDDECVARNVGSELGIDTIRANLLPEDKVAGLEELAAGVHARRGRLAFVGDGVNDAPVLSRADVGVAMGGLGSEAAIEAADVVIMDDDLGRLPLAVQIARRTRSVVRQNIGFALGAKGLFIILGAVGLASIWEAVFADVGVSLLAVVNAVRTLRFRPRPHPRSFNDQGRS